jgi:hypothetical protein
MVRAIVILCPRRENPTSINFFGESERWKYLTESGLALQATTELGPSKRF